MAYTETDLLNAIREAADSLGHPPTYDEFNEMDGPCSKTIENRFDSWAAAKREAGVQDTGAYGKLPVQRDYFESIDTTDRAYWLGMMYGDGSIIEHEPNDRVYLGLIDREHVVAFKKALGASHSVRAKDDGVYCITITDQQLADDLTKWGCDSEKTFSSSLPELSDDALRAAFVRGLFDADGSVKNANRFQLTGASRERFETLLSWLPCDPYIRDAGGKYVVHVGKERGVDDLWNWLYPDGVATEPALDRKMAKIHNHPNYDK